MLGKTIESKYQSIAVLWTISSQETFGTTISTIDSGCQTS